MVGKVFALHLERNLILRKNNFQNIMSGKIRFSFLKRLSAKATNENVIIPSFYEHEVLRTIKKMLRGKFVSSY